MSAFNECEVIESDLTLSDNDLSKLILIERPFASPDCEEEQELVTLEVIGSHTDENKANER